MQSFSRADRESCGVAFCCIELVKWFVSALCVRAWELSQKASLHGSWPFRFLHLSFGLLHEGSAVSTDSL